MSFRTSLKNLIRRDPAASLHERAAELRASIPASKPQAEPLAPEPTHADQVAQAGLTGGVLAVSGIDHRDGTVSYADATGKVSRRPMSHWVGFNALQMHSHVQGEIARRRIVEANPLPADEYEAWEAKIRREMRSDAVFALAFHPERAFNAAQDLRSGAEPISAEVRASGDADLVALTPEWEAARDLYAQRFQDQIAVSDAAQPSPSHDQPHVEWARQVAEWRERTGVEAAEEAAAEALDELCAIEDHIAELPAASLAGLKLKARVAQRSDDINVDWPQKLGEGLIRDLLAFGDDGLVGENPAGDALLLQLGRQFEAARKRETAACDACNAAQDEANRHMPERPAVLLFRASDHPLRLGKFLTHPDHLEGTEVTADDTAWMKRKTYVREVRRPVRPKDNLPADARTVVDTYPWPEAQERADEIVTAWEAWHAERLRIHGEYVTAEISAAADEAGEQATDLALRIAEMPARTVAGFRVKLRALACYNPSFFYLNPPELPDPDQALSHSLWRDVRDEAAPAIEPTMTPAPAVEPAPVAQSPAASPQIDFNLAGMLDLASATLEDLQSLHDIADQVGTFAYALAWTGRCKVRGTSHQFNAAGELMQRLGDALTDVESAAIREAKRRQPRTPDDREIRLKILALPVIQNGDHAETAAFARELAAHAEAERAGR